jgi:hypothetical protein
MSAIVVPLIGLRKILDSLTGTGPSNVLNASAFRLYSAISPALGQNTVLGDFTECTFGGYSSVNVSSWGAATVLGNRGKIDATDLLWTCNGSGGQNVLGVYVTDNSGVYLIFAEQFDSAIPMFVNSDILPYHPTLSDRAFVA